jgi:hypothetical protein
MFGPRGTSWTSQLANVRKAVDSHLRAAVETVFGAFWVTTTPVRLTWYRPHHPPQCHGSEKHDWAGVSHGAPLSLARVTFAAHHCWEGGCS